MNAENSGLEPSWREGCTPPLEPDEQPEVGQVWELLVDDELEPSVLLSLYVGKLGRDNQEYWRCLSLESGRVFSAATRRWDPTWFGHRSRGEDGLPPLLGRRLL